MLLLKFSISNKKGIWVITLVKEIFYKKFTYKTEMISA